MARSKHTVRPWTCTGALGPGWKTYADISRGFARCGALGVSFARSYHDTGTFKKQVFQKYDISPFLGPPGPETNPGKLKRVPQSGYFLTKQICLASNNMFLRPSL